MLQAISMPSSGNAHVLSTLAGDSLPGARPASAAKAVVPIRPIGPTERSRILRHLLALPPQDRYLRFGYAATDEQVGRYVDGLDFKRDEIFGIYNRNLDLIGLAHLAYDGEGDMGECAEFGVSVSAHARQRGYGMRLFQRAMVHARNKGVHMLFIYALSENIPMLRIARNAGATVEQSGGEAEAHLRLPMATFDSRMSEVVGDQFAEIDFRLKERAKRFWRVLGGLQEVRRGVRDARDSTAR